jgi:hypothetical protein
MKFLYTIFCVLYCLTACAQNSFQVVPLGVKGGTDESNLSAYAVAATGTSELKNFPIVITHMKPFKDREQIIRQQLAASNI